MLTKGLLIKEMDDKGNGLAQIADMSAVDSDDDTYMAGAFSWKQNGGQWTQILPAHDRKAMPFGKSWVYEKDNFALADFSLNLSTTAGKDWYEALKFDLAKGEPVQEWSYGFDVLDADFQQRGDKRIRILKRLDVYEISPVLRGAGVGTGTLAIKSAQLKDAQFEALIAQLGELADAVKGDPALLSATGMKQLVAIHEALGTAIAPDDQAEAIAKSHLVLEQAHAGMLARMARPHFGA